MGSGDEDKKQGDKEVEETEKDPKAAANKGEEDSDDEKPEAKEDDEEKRKKKLKAGDYNIQVHIIEGRDLKGRGIGDMSDPVVVVQCLGKKKSTKIQKKALNPFFDELLYFQHPKLEPAEVESGKIIVSVFDANTFRRNQLIGMYEFDVAGVYYRKNHEMFRQWVALTDVTDKFEGIQGYLKVSIVVLGPDDEQYIHSAAEEDDDEGSGLMNVLLPPQVEQHGFLLKVTVYEVDELPQMDAGFFGGKCDPYVRVEFSGNSVDTEKRTGQSVSILQELQLPVMEPLVGGNIRLSVMDWDMKPGKDDRIKTMNFDYMQIKANGFLPQWVNLYGAPHGQQRGVAAKMNRGYLPGSTYRGRVLLKMSVEENKEPKKDVTPALGCPPELMPRTEQWALQCDLYEGSEIPDRGDMHVEICVGNRKYSSRSVNTQEGRCKWYDEIKDQDKRQIVFTYPADPEQVPDIFVYLCQKNERISFTNIKFSDAVKRGWRVPPTWTTLKEDPTGSGLKAGSGDFPGTLLMSLRVGNMASLPGSVLPESRPINNPLALARAMTPLDATDETVVVTEEVVQPAAPEVVSERSTVGTLTVDIVEARSLPIMDKNSSDPYVKLKVGAQSYESKCIKTNLNPVWNETTNFSNVSIDQPIRVSLWDKDMLSDELMGDFEVSLRSEERKANVKPGMDWVVDNWYMISDKFPNAAVRLRWKMKFLSITESKAIETYIEKKAEKERKSFVSTIKKLTRTSSASGSAPGSLGQPKTEQFQLRVHLYQARGLPASDATGLADPYVVVRLCGKKIAFDKKIATLNPHWYATKAVNVDVPVPFSIAPRIQCFIYDWDNVSKDDAIGRFDLTLDEVCKVNPRPDVIVPRWFQLRDWKDDDIPGAEMLVGFQLLNSLDAVRPLPNIVPPTQPMYLEITTLGLRDLNSIWGVHKPFIEFLMPATKMTKTKKSNLPSAMNPNFLQVVKIPVQLPVDRLYAPTVDLRVKDSLFGGLIKRLLGATSLNLGQYMLEDNAPEGKGTGRWRGSDQIEVLDEKQLQREIEDEEAEATRQAAEKKAREEEEAKLQEAKRKASTGATGNNVNDTADVPVGSKPRPKQLGVVANSAADPATDSPSINTSTYEDDSALLVKKKKGDETSAALREPLLKPDQPLPGAVTSKSPKTSNAAAPKGEGLGIGVGPVPVLDKPDMHDDAHEAQPLLSPNDAKRAGKDVVIDVKEFPEDNEAKDAFHSDELTADEKVSDEPEEVQPYMRGRNIVDNELEDEMKLCPFHSLEVKTGQTRGAVASHARTVGFYKGLVRITDRKDVPNTINVNELLQPKEMFLRLYVLRATKLIPMDMNGKADPYLVIKLGKQKISTRERHLNKTLEPEFFESFEIPCTIPGDSKLQIDVMDWDGIGDDLIGSTVIDVEDRWFSKSWRKLKMKPLERRTLHCPTSSASQGKLELFMELVSPIDAKKTPMWNIRPPPPETYELRCIIWGVREVTIKDTFTDQNDLYVTCQPGGVKGLKKQETDTHLRAKGGKGNFNWRMKWQFELPARPAPRLRFQIWDKDFFSANDSICESVISLKGLCKQVLKKKDRVKVFVKGKDRFWVENLRHPNFQGNQGKMEISLELMPASVAAQLPAGYGRSDPNQNPFLPPPEGRVQWSLWHPLNMLREILGDKLYFKLCGGLFCCIVLGALSMLLPTIISRVIAEKII